MLGLDELITEVRSCLGRDTDDELVTDTRIIRWLNAAQEDLCEEVLGIPQLDMKNVDSVDTTEVLRYSLADWTSPLSDVTTENRVCWPMAVYYVDGEDSHLLDYLPVDRFDEVIDPTNSDAETGKPLFWTRRGDSLELRPLSACSYCDMDLRLDGQVYAPDFTYGSSCESVIRGADEGLIRYAVWKGWEAIGGEKGRMEQVNWKNKYEEWRNGFKAKTEIRAPQWDQNIYG